MTKMIQIRNVPDDIHRTLKMKAAKEGLSLSQLLLREATRVATTLTLAEWLEMLESERRLRPKVPINAEEIVEAIREGRKERTGAIETALREAGERT